MKYLLFLILMCFSISAHAESNNAKRFLGKWSGYWDNQWPMSIEVLSVNDNSAQVIYTWPDGSSRNSGIISGNQLKLTYIVMTLTGPSKAIADGNFPKAHRTAKLSR